MQLRNKQNGVVLLVSLVLLTITTFVGFSALETSTLENKMATSRELSELVFHAAETAIEESIDDQTFLGNALLKHLAGSTDWPNKTHAYTEADTHDDHLQAITRAVCKGQTRAVGGSLDKDAGGVAEYLYVLESTASRQDTNFSATHEQGFRVLAAR